MAHARLQLKRYDARLGHRLAAWHLLQLNRRNPTNLTGDVALGRNKIAQTPVYEPRGTGLSCQHAVWGDHMSVRAHHHVGPGVYGLLRHLPLLLRGHTLPPYAR